MSYLFLFSCICLYRQIYHTVKINAISLSTERNNEGTQVVKYFRLDNPLALQRVGIPPDMLPGFMNFRFRARAMLRIARARKRKFINPGYASYFNSHLNMVSYIRNFLLNIYHRAPKAGRI